MVAAVPRRRAPGPGPVIRGFRRDSVAFPQHHGGNQQTAALLRAHNSRLRARRISGWPGLPRFRPRVGPRPAGPRPPPGRPGEPPGASGWGPRSGTSSAGRRPPRGRASSWRPGRERRRGGPGAKGPARVAAAGATPATRLACPAGRRSPRPGGNRPRRPPVVRSARPSPAARPRRPRFPSGFRENLNAGLV